MGLAGSCMKNRRCRIMGRLGRDLGCRQEWSLRSNQWSTWVALPSRFLRIDGLR